MTRKASVEVGVKTLEFTAYVSCKLAPERQRKMDPNRHESQILYFTRRTVFRVASVAGIISEEYRLTSHSLHPHEQATKRFSPGTTALPLATHVDKMRQTSTGNGSEHKVRAWRACYPQFHRGCWFRGSCWFCC